MSHTWNFAAFFISSSVGVGEGNPIIEGPIDLANARELILFFDS